MLLTGASVDILIKGNRIKQSKISLSSKEINTPGDTLDQRVICPNKGGRVEYVNTCMNELFIMF